VLTARVIRNVIDAAKKLGKARDRRPQERQSRDLSRRDLLKPNRKEFAEATRSRVDSEEEHRRRRAGNHANWRIAKPCW